MPYEITLNSFDDLEPALNLLIDRPDEMPTVHVAPDAVVTIILNGKTWDGFVDVRVARFVAELQKAYDRMRKEFGLPRAEANSLVKVRVKDGSTELESNLLRLLSDMVDGMESSHKLFLGIAILLVLGGAWTLKQLLEYFKRQQEQLQGHEKDMKTIQILSDGLQRSLQIIDPEKPTRTLVASMAENDTIQLPKANPISRDDAKQRYPRKPRVVPIDAKIDDNFHVESIALERPVRLNLAKGDIHFHADLAAALEDADKTAFVERVRASLDTGVSVRMALWVDAKIGQSAIAEATIVGINRAPRDGAEDVAGYFD